MGRCLPIGCLKVFITIGCLGIIGLGGVIIVYGAIWMSNDALQNLSFLTVLRFSVYGLGAFIVVLGLLGILSCSSENLCALFLFQLFSILIFVTFLGCFLAIVIGKNILIDQFKRMETVHLMYDNVELVCNSLFNGTVCPGVYRVQDCPEDQKNNIVFRGNTPAQFWMDIAGWSENVFKCRGLDHHKLCKFCFSNYTNPSTDTTCDAAWNNFLDTTLGNFNYIMISGIAIVCGLFLTAIFGCCLCCHPDRKGHKEVNEKLQANIIVKGPQLGQSLVINSETGKALLLQEEQKK